MEIGNLDTHLASKQFFPYTTSMWYEPVKRILDIILAIILLILFSPVLLITMIAIKLDSPGPVLADTPERVGKNGKLFRMYKFRSMIQNA